MTKRFGFVGLGNMGFAMAANIIKGGFDLAVFDQAGSQQKAPEKTRPVESLAELAETCDTLFLCLPDGLASGAIAQEIVLHPVRCVRCVIDFSTVGVEASQKISQTLSAADIAYVDAPVSGGRSGALAGSITVIWAGAASLMEEHRPVLEALAGNIIHVGEVAGQGQSMKLLNNFLSAMAMTATSEAVHYGLAQGLDLETMLHVLNVSSGKNTATLDKFPHQIATKKFAAGFQTSLMQKDLSLFLESVQGAQTPRKLSTLLTKIWQQADEAMPGSDFSKIFEFLKSQ